MIKTLTEQEYLATMKSGMTDVTYTAEPPIDIWPYVQLLSNDGLINPYVVDKALVEKVYQSNNGLYHHLLLPTSTTNRFIVVVVSIEQPEIIGYHQLNLDELYQ